MSFHVLSKTVYNGDALTRLNIETDPQHDYYAVGIRGPLEMADFLRQFNIMRVTVMDDIIKVSGSTDQWQWLLYKLRQDGSKGATFLADNLEALGVFQVQRQSLSRKSGTRR